MERSWPFALADSVASGSRPFRIGFSYLRKEKAGRFREESVSAERSPGTGAAAEVVRAGRRAQSAAAGDEARFLWNPLLVPRIPGLANVTMA